MTPTDKDIERLDGRIDKTIESTDEKFEKIGGAMTEIKVLLARMDERDQQVFGKLEDGHTSFADLNNRVGVLETSRTYLKGYSVPVLGIFSVVGLLVVSGLTYGLHIFLARLLK